MREKPPTGAATGSWASACASGGTWQRCGYPWPAPRISKRSRTCAASPSPTGSALCWRWRRWTPRRCCGSCRIEARRYAQALPWALSGTSIPPPATMIEPRTLFPALLCLLAMPLVSQVHISGDVANAPDSAVASLTFYNNTIEYDEITAATAQLDGNGHFAFSIPWEAARPASMTIAEQYTRVFLSPGDSLHLSVDYERFDSTLHYNGAGAEANNYMAADVLGAFQRAASAYMAFSDGNAYKLFVDSVERLSNALWQRYDRPGISQAFRDYIRPELQYRFVNPRYMFQIGYDQEKKKFYTKEVPPGYFDFLATIDRDDQAAADNGTYALALNRSLGTLHDSKHERSDSIPEEEQTKALVRRNYNYRKSIFTGKVLDRKSVV